MISAENFQLEVAQSSVPWRVIAPPIVNTNPIDPSLGKSLPRGLLRSHQALQPVWFVTALIMSSTKRR